MAPVRPVPTGQVAALDAKRLIKLLKLTRSPEPGEALSALRKAQDCLDKADLSWEDIINKNPVRFESLHQRNSFVERLIIDLEGCSGCMNQWQNNFLISIKSQYEVRKSISSKQQEVLETIWHEMKRKYNSADMSGDLTL